MVVVNLYDEAYISYTICHVKTFLFAFIFYVLSKAAISMSCVMRKTVFCI